MTYNWDIYVVNFDLLCVQDLIKDPGNTTIHDETHPAVWKTWSYAQEELR